MDKLSGERSEAYETNAGTDSRDGAVRYVSVFASGADRKPLQVTGIEVAGLRRADQELLRGGITVGSQEQLLLLLEDLGS